MHLRYPLTEPVNGQDYIVVATTRPETMLGDTGVAVSPKDPEKAAFVGKTVKLPIVDREIPIFEDWHVDANFGSGFVKVTPAHDPTITPWVRPTTCRRSTSSTSTRWSSRATASLPA